VGEADAQMAARAHAGSNAETMVVVPASNLSRLDWLTNAEDDARAQAAEQAEAIAQAAPSQQTEAREGDPDPVKAIEDALREFGADEVLLITRPDEEATWLEKGIRETVRDRFSLPVTHLTVKR
jgi:GABA permease